MAATQSQRVTFTDGLCGRSPTAIVAMKCRSSASSTTPGVGGANRASTPKGTVTPLSVSASLSVQ